MRDVVVVGASLAGLRAAEALRTQGYAGKLRLIGQEPHAPYDRPPLSKQVLRGEWDASRARLSPDAAALGLDLTLSVRAVALDPVSRTLELSNGEQLSYDGLVIATGASPRKPGFGAGLSGVHVLRTLDDALAISAALARRPRVCVVGAGFIGLEVASSCRALGLEVTVVEPLALPLSPKLGEPMARVVEALHRDAGVLLETGDQVAALEGDGRVERVLLASGKRFEADLVIAGLGVTPVVDWLQGSGIVLDNGVLCDATSATSLPEVVAVGDVARMPNAWLGEAEGALRIEHWTHAVEVSSHAARRLLAGPSSVDPFSNVPYFWSDQHGVKIQFAGLAKPGDEIAVVDGSTETRRFVALYGRHGRVMGALAIGRPALLARYRKQMHEGLRFDEAVAAARKN